MRSYTAVIAASSLLSVVSGAPLFARGNTCGATPASSNTKNQPIRQPSGIQTSADCQSHCNETSECQSFCFGLVDNVIQCKLFSCSASAIPVQSSVNLVVYDKTCSSVPSVVPTSNNPTGKKDNQEKPSDAKPANHPQSTPQQPATGLGQQKYQQKSSDSKDNNEHDEKKPSPTPTPSRPVNVPQGQGQQKAPSPTPAAPHPQSPKQGQDQDQPKTSPTPTPYQPEIAPQDKAQKKPSPTPTPYRPEIAALDQDQHQQKPSPTPTPAAYRPENAPQQKPSPTPTPAVSRPQSTPQAQQQNKQQDTSSNAKTCGSKPAGTVSHEPFATPPAPSVDDCKAQCSAHSDCKSFACGTVSNVFTCKLYSVEASAIPAPADPAQKLALVAYDVSCSV